MRESEATAAPPGFPSRPRWLLIGNSRWHWAGALSRSSSAEDPGDASGPRRLWLRHTLPRPDGEGVMPSPEGLLGWAAVGPIPAGFGLSAGTRLSLDEIPLAGLPPWLGIDRALGGWQAWRHRGGSVLVADAGTVLSLTRVDAGGRFVGGRLLAGLGLQLRAMASGTAALPDLPAAGETAPPPERDAPPAWPAETAAAMASGVIRGLAAAILAAITELRHEDPGCRLVLTGGDGEALLPLLLAAEASPLHQPSLVMEALAGLRPDPSWRPQA